MDGDDFLVETRKGGRRGKKKVAPKERDSGHEFTTNNSAKLPLKNEELCNADGDSFQQKDNPKLHQRLSREEKQYNQALQQAISKSKSSSSLVSSSNEDKQEEEENSSSQNVSHETEFDIDSPDQTMDSDDDFLPSPKPKKSKKSVGKRTLTKTGSSKVKTKVTTNTIPTTTSAVVECVQLPEARNQVLAAVCNTAKGKTDDIADKSLADEEKSFQSKYVPPVVRGSRNIRPGKTRDSPIIGGGVSPVIRVGLSRKAPVKHLHKQKVT